MYFLNVYVHICINMGPCICVSPKVACFYEWYVSVYWEFHERNNFLLFLSYIPRLWLDTEGWGSIQPPGGQDWASRFSPEPWHLSQAHWLLFSQPQCPCLSNMAAERKDTLLHFLCVAQGFTPSSHFAREKQKRTYLFLKTILKWEAEEFAVRIIRASGLRDRLMLSKTFGCEEVWFSMGVQGKGDTLMLNSSQGMHIQLCLIHLPSPPTSHFFFLAALRLVWWSGDRNDGDQWPSWFRETGLLINSTSNFLSSGWTFQ